MVSFDFRCDLRVKDVPLDHGAVQLRGDLLAHRRKHQVAAVEVRDVPHCQAQLLFLDGFELSCKDVELGADDHYW